MKKLLQRVRVWVSGMAQLLKQKKITQQIDPTCLSRELLLTQLFRYSILNRAKISQIRGHSNSWRVEMDSFFHAYNLFCSLRETSEIQAKHTAKHSYYSCKMGDSSNIVLTDRVRKSSSDVAALHQTSTLDNTTILIVHFSPRK